MWYEGALAPQIIGNFPISRVKRVSSAEQSGACYVSTLSLGSRMNGRQQVEPRNVRRSNRHACLQTPRDYS
jgi:hypothetical protein